MKIAWNLLFCSAIIREKSRNIVEKQMNLLRRVRSFRYYSLNDLYYNFELDSGINRLFNFLRNCATLIHWSTTSIFSTDIRDLSNRFSTFIEPESFTLWMKCVSWLSGTLKHHLGEVSKIEEHNREGIRTSNDTWSKVHLIISLKDEKRHLNRKLFIVF